MPEGAKVRPRFLRPGKRKRLGKMVAGKNEEALVTLLSPNAG
ncbi:hypothetical protein B4135_3196 [Caldibacillus debilis]|uniref:Uncharacterized protein n=1 Tax=Caldibacillus debilis TaxID=301148 RepID=A0A150LHC5_9BACI|nr:hypothetical protein B4135_3196 [Caldibacillus debilis]